MLSAADQGLAAVSGATVREPFVVADMRGLGWATLRGNVLELVERLPLNEDRDELANGPTVI